MPRKKAPEPVEEPRPMVSRGIFAFLLVIFAIIIILSFFDAAGPIGFTLNEGILNILMGTLRFLAPLIVFGIASIIIQDPDEPRFSAMQLFGAFLFIVSLAGLLHMRFPAQDMWYHAMQGKGIHGGTLGMIAWPLKMYTGGIATPLILFGLLFVSLVLMVNELITHYLSAHRKVVSGIGGMKQVFAKRDKTEEDDEDMEEEGDDEDYEEEDEETEEDEELPPKRRFFSRRMRHAEEEDEDEETEEDEEGFDDEDVEEDDNEESTVQEEPTPAAQPQPVSSAHEAGAWAQHVIIREVPPVDLLVTRKGKPTSGDIKTNAKIIKDTLAEFNINVDMGEARVGPTVTQYTLKPRKGVKLSKITSLSKDLALALAARTIRIEAPIPGKSLVGIEVPNEKTAMVTFKELLESKQFNTRPHNMMIGLGKDVGGKIWFADLPSMPHLLVAGTTGSGKTVCVNTIILSLLYQNTAETLRMIMVDPKRVELTLYNGIPHLLTPVITNTQQTVNALKWCIGEMERRFEMLQSVGNRDITSYNKAHPNDKIPHIVFVIDELADLMATAAGEVESGIIRLAQMARAVGIHLVLATQRPSVDVITGLMKANIPGRIAFSVASIIDSRTILDAPGAEKLLGKGDMLLSTAALGQPVRIQGAFVSEEELKKVVEYLKGDEEPQYDESIVSKGGGTANLFGGPSDDQDPLFIEAKRAVIEAGKASASFLQRKLKVGYARAARILDELEAAGIIGPADGAKPREILVNETELDNTPAQKPGSPSIFIPTPPPVKTVDLSDTNEDNSEEDLEEDDEDMEEEYDDEEYDEENEEEEDQDDEDYDEEEEYEEEEEEEEEEDDDDDDDDEIRYRI